MSASATPIKTIIVDDELLARQNVEALLRLEPDFEIVAQCRSGQEARDAITHHQPDLMLLDIHMPGMSGFEMLAKLPVELLPQVIFITAFDHFAVRAFEVEAVDYVLKPFNRARFSAALTRAKAAVGSHNQQNFARKLDEMAATLQELRASAAQRELTPPPPPPPPEADNRVLIRCDGEIHLLAPDDIIWIESDGDYVRLHLTERARLVRMTLRRMMAKLNPNTFVRIHRSTVINLKHMAKACPALYGEYAVVLGNGVRLRVSRTFVHNLKSRL